MHVSLPRVYRHKQVLLSNYAVTCYPALLCPELAMGLVITHCKTILTAVERSVHNFTFQFYCLYTVWSFTLSIKSHFY